MEKNEVLIKVNDLSKKFSKDLKTSLWYGIKDLFLNFGGDENDRLLRPTEFWALQNINFELKRGECLGLIGHNGAGKSTLLKILNGLISPDTGSVTIKGKVGALIELGAGFNPILTGRENIYNNGAILGFTKAEIDNKIEAIIDFSEIREFIDMPVQNYSSGMKVRLGFSIASQMEPDVLLIDEVLAVGDLGFVLKCFKVIDQILPNTAIVFVSHSMPMVSRISSQVILMEKGKNTFYGTNVSKGIDMYYNKFSENNDSDLVYSNNYLELVDSSVQNQTPNDNNIYQINWGSTQKLNFTIKNNKLKSMPYIALAVYDKEQRAVAEIHPKGQKLNSIWKNTEQQFNVTVKNIYLSKGVYHITFIASESLGYNIYYKIHKALSIQIMDDRQMWTPFLMDSQLDLKE